MLVLCFSFVCVCFCLAFCLLLFVVLYSIYCLSPVFPSPYIPYIVWGMRCLWHLWQCWSSSLTPPSMFGLPVTILRLVYHSVWSFPGVPGPHSPPGVWNICVVPPTSGSQSHGGWHDHWVPGPHQVPDPHCSCGEGMSVLWLGWRH